MSEVKASHLRVVTDAEASLLELRSRARARFISQYPKQESRRTMLGALDRIAATFSDDQTKGRDFPWELLIDDDLAKQVWSSVLKKYEPATAKRDASALKVMLQCCWRVGLLSHEQYVSASSFASTVVSDGELKGRTLEEEEIARLINYLDPTAHQALQARDAAVILLMASTGARRNEIAHIDLKDLDLEGSRVRLIVTKNGHPRDAWLHTSTVAALEMWLAVRGDKPGSLLVPLSRTCRPLIDRRLSAHQIWKIVGRRAQACGVGHLTPHDMRRYLVSTLLDQGVDLTLVSRIVGHKDPATTAKYDRRPAERCREAVANLRLPPPAWGTLTA